MDVFTHVLLAFAAGVVLHAMLRPRSASGTAYGLVAAASALAPDLDAFVSPLARIDALYWLQHRGASHSLLGAPVAALLFVLLLGRLSRRWPSLAPTRWWPGAWAPLLLGAWSHLLLDGVTHHGVPLLWPLSPRAWSLEVYHWIVWWLAPPSAGILWLRWRRHWSDTRVAQAAVVILAVVVVLGAVRVGLAPEGDAYATQDPRQWIVVDLQEGGARVDRVQGDRSLDAAWYAHDVPPGAEAAVHAVRQTDAYRGFLMASTGPLVWQASLADDDAWNLTALDVVQRFEVRDAPFGRAWAKEAGTLHASVSVDGARIQDLRWR